MGGPAAFGVILVDFGLAAFGWRWLKADIRSACRERAIFDQNTSFVERRGNGCFCRNWSFIHPRRSGRGNGWEWDRSVGPILGKWLWKATLAVTSQG